MHTEGQPIVPGCQQKQREGPGSSWETPAAVWARWLEPTLLPSSPRFLWGQDFRLREEIEALLQGEVASPGCFAGRAWVLHTFQLLGFYQHEFLEALIVLPHQGKGAVVCQIQGGVTCEGAQTSHTCPSRLDQATLLKQSCPSQLDTEIKNCCQNGTGAPWLGSPCWGSRAPQPAMCNVGTALSSSQPALSVGIPFKQRGDPEITDPLRIHEVGRNWPICWGEQECHAQELLDRGSRQQSPSLPCQMQLYCPVWATITPGLTLCQTASGTLARQIHYPARGCKG